MIRKGSAVYTTELLLSLAVCLSVCVCACVCARVLIPLQLFWCVCVQYTRALPRAICVYYRGQAVVVLCFGSAQFHPMAQLAIYSLVCLAYTMQSLVPPTRVCVCRLEWQACIVYAWPVVSDEHSAFTYVPDSPLCLQFGLCLQFVSKSLQAYKLRSLILYLRPQVFGLAGRLAAKWHQCTNTSML